MSNLTPHDVDVRLTTARNELVEEDTRLREGLEDEKVSRIAGDEANNQFTLQVQNENAGTETRLSTEVIHRSEGDLSSITSLNALAAALSDYRIKTDLEIATEKIALQQLGVDLNTRVDYFVASWDHKQFLLYQAIQTVQADVNNKYSSMDVRIRKYENMLQDITTDSIQITMDNGEINMGAWTILSQAREWDLEILTKVSGYQDKTTVDLNQALEDLQNKLPIEQDLISKVIEALSDAPIITKLSDMLNSSISNQDDIEQRLIQEAVARTEDIINLASQQAIELAKEKQVLADKINLEAQERIDAITREGEIRYNQIVDLEDGFTSRFDLIETEQSTSLTAFNNYKASTDNSLANFNTSINLISSDLASQGSVVSALDLRLKDTEKTAVSAVTKSEAALTETSAQAEIINGITASLADKADASALSTLGAEITDLDGKLSLNTSSVTQLQGSLDNVNDELSNKASLTALNSLSGNVETIGNQTVVNTNALTNLKNRVDVVEGVVAVKLDASVISDYYTRGQADDKSAEIAAGKIESYNANLVIGGANLLTETKTFNKAETIEFSKTTLRPNYAGFGSAFITDPDSMLWRTHTVMQVRKDWCGFYYSCNSDNPADWFADQDMTLSVWVFNNSNADVSAYGIVPALGHVATISSGGWQRIVLHIDKGRTLRNANNQGIIEFNFTSTEGAFYYAAPMLQYGNAVTSWQPSSEEVQNALGANASAIQSINAEVARVNGEVVSTANSVSTLSSNVGLLQGSINEVRQTVTNNQESTNTLVTSLKSGMADADDVSMMIRNATVLFEDLNFRDGYNDVTIYNHQANGALACNLTDKLPDNPVASTRQLQFIHSGGATAPALGGYYQITLSRPNGVFLVKFVAKLPVGFSFGLGYNAYGDGANSYFIGSSEGTGKFKTYYAVYRCGATGDFSSIGFVYVNGQRPTPENPLIWYLASSTIYDCLDSKVAPDSVVNGIAEAKSTASTAVNKAEATAQIAQNIQAALDNTNATVASNYLVHVNATQAIAAQSTEITSKLARMSEDNLLQNSDFSAGSIKGWDIGSYLDDYSIIRTKGAFDDYSINAGMSETFAIHSAGVSSGYVDLTQKVTVKENRSYQVSCYAAVHRCIGRVFCYFYRADGTLISNSPVEESNQIVNAYEAWGGKNTSDYKRIYQNVTTPADTYSMTIAIRRSGGDNAYMFVTRAQLVEIFDENLVPWQSSSVQDNATIKETTKSINGIEAVKTVTIDNNGVMSGYGLISELKNGQVTSSFGVNADTFFIGAPASNKKPFIVTSYPQTINGVSYPVGTYIDVALIANATIGTAKIQDLAVTTAKIANLAVTDAKIESLNAAKITAGFVSADRIQAGSISADKISVAAVEAISVAARSYTAYKNPSNPNGARTVVGGGSTTIYDDNGVERIFLGVR